MEKDRQDKSAAGWDYKENVPLHESQKGSFAALCNTGFSRVLESFINRVFRFAEDENDKH